MADPADPAVPADPTKALIERAYARAFDTRMREPSAFTWSYEYTMLNATQYYSVELALFSRNRALAVFEDWEQHFASPGRARDRFLEAWDRDTRPNPTDPRYVEVDEHYVRHSPTFFDGDILFVQHDLGLVCEYAWGPGTHLRVKDPVTANMPLLVEHGAAAGVRFFVRRDFYRPMDVPVRRGASLQTLVKRTGIKEPKGWSASRWARIPSYANFFTP
jgi:hypothetical protein